MAVKPYVVSKTINGKEYVAQFNGISASLKAIDSSYIDGTSITSLEKIANYLFENVIVSPKTSINDFGANKIGKKEKKEINGKEYTAVYNGMAQALRAIDNSYTEDGENVSIEKLSDYILENVVVKPANLTVDDFDSMKELNDVVAFARDVMQGGKEIKEEFDEVIAFAREVMQGNFREEKNAKPDKAASKG